MTSRDETAIQTSKNDAAVVSPTRITTDQTPSTANLHYSQQFVSQPFFSQVLSDSGQPMTGSSPSENTQQNDQLDSYYDEALPDQLQQLHLSEASIPQLKHWSEVMYECNEIVLEEWAIAGGSDYGQLHYFITTGDILLEIDGQKIAGLTRADVLRLIVKQSSHSIKAVSSSSSFGLPIDLKEYLSRRFVRGSIDHDLQATVRDNVYLRTVPCTTRPSRSNEVDGVDYKFVTRQEFSDMERSGVLLESGIYAGHFYGTPLPLAESLPPAGLHSSTCNVINGSVPTSIGPEASISATTASVVSSITNPNASVDQTSTQNQPQPSALALKRRRNRSNIAAIDASSLPHGWERISDVHYGVYYIDHINKRTQYERPYELELSKGSSGFGFTLVEVDSGLVVVKSVLDGGAAFSSGVIQPGDVLVSVSGVSVAGLQHKDIAKLFSTFSAGDRVKLTFARGYALPPEVFGCGKPGEEKLPNSIQNNLRSPHEEDFELLSITIAKGTEGFGFTISDGGPEGQRVKKILDTKRCGLLCQGDILAYVNRIDLAGLNHSQVVEVLKHHCHVGEQSSFVVRRLKGQIRSQNLSEKTRSKTPGAENINSRPNYARETCTLPGRNCKTPSAELLRKQISGWSASNGNIAQSSSSSLIAPQQHNHLPQPHLPPQYEHTPINPAYAGLAMNGYANTRSAYSTVANGHSPADRMNLAYSNSCANGIDLGNNTYANAGVSVLQEGVGSYLEPRHEYEQQLYTSRERLGFSYADRSSTLTGERGQISAFDGAINNDGEDEFEYFRVSLQRGEAGFGFRIVGGAEESRAVTIGSIVIGGCAHLDGILRAGDELISINDRNVMNASHHHVVELMAECGQSVSLLVRRLKHSDAFDVQLQRDPNEGFGFVIISCGQCALIGRIIENSPAARCQRLKIRDKIIAVNGVDITQMSHPEIVNMIKDSGLSLRLRIVPADCYTVELVRGPKGFGFSIRGGAEFNGMPLFILRVAPDGPAWSLLNVGDEIIEINSRSTVDLTHAQAVLWISQSAPHVKLKLRRQNVINPIEQQQQLSGTMMSLNSVSSLNALASGTTAGLTSLNTSNMTGDLQQQQSLPGGVFGTDAGQTINGFAYQSNGNYTGY